MNARFVCAAGVAVTVIIALGPMTLNAAAGAADPLCNTSDGPDVIVGDIAELITNYSSENGLDSFSVGTTSCNIGDAELMWVGTNNQHPVIAQNLYRLKDGRFEQIGQSWLKHGFYALQHHLCCVGCFPSGSGTRLGVGCADPYTAVRNGSQASLGPRWQVNASTGAFPWPPANPTYRGIAARRLHTRVENLDPETDGGGAYFVEAQYVTPDDAAAGNQNNNASHRAVTITGSGTNWTMAVTAEPTQRERPAIRAWKDRIPAVVETDVQVPGDGLLIIAALATDTGQGWYAYEYAVHNLNSDRSVRTFTIPVPLDAIVTDLGFHDVGYHSGEPYDGTDWTGVHEMGSVTWSTSTYTDDTNANALRWGTLYNFRFRCNAPPGAVSARLGLFKPGTPDMVEAATTGPAGATPPCAGDFDGDGTIGFSDLLELIGSWGPCTGCPADLDQSGDVGFSDVLVMMVGWGPCTE